MKKIIVLVLAGLLIFLLAACGQKQTDTKTEQKEEVTAPEEVEEAEEVEAAEEAEEAALEGNTGEGSAAAASSEEAAPIVGGWSAAESPEVPDEVKALLEKAAEGMDGAEYEPVAYLGSQVVAGTNYRLLCRITPVVPDAVSHYSIVTLYEDLDGNVSITEIFDSQAEGEALPGELMGAWENPESPDMTDEAKAALDKALEKLVGADYKPIALLATQLVSGTNYSILCQVTPVVPNAESSFVIAHVYQDLEGNAEITEVFDFSAEE
jgi:hypothetical protein